MAKRIIEIPYHDPMPDADDDLPDIYAADDLARDNLELDMAAADRADLRRMAAGSAGEAL